MAKRHRRQAPQAAPRRALTAAAVIAAAVMIAAAVWSVVRGGRQEPAESGGLIAELSGYRGTTRTVGREEYDFFYGQVERELYGDREGADMDRLTRERINGVNAKFILGDYLGLCEPYDFAVMQYRMEQENTIRAAKSAKGEAVYGPTQFTLETYFDYLESSLDSGLVNYLAEHADDGMKAQARAYYDADPARCSPWRGSGGGGKLPPFYCRSAITIFR